MPRHADPETYKKVHDAGFAGHQNRRCLCAAWTPGREDVLLSLAGEIEDEDSRSLNVRKLGRSGLPDTAESGPVNPHRHLMKWKDWPR
ncbi:hypothetical protein ECP02999172_5492 [Escherichia coli P0299917.2]|nr:hypothetical protein ECP02999172_5492 [Escherichia coli P0299917.2]